MNYNQVNLTLNIQVPATPYNMRSTERNTTSMTVEWEQDGETHDYIVSIAPPDGTVSVDVNGRTAVFTGLTPGTNYTVNVTAISGEWTGETSEDYVDGTGMYS